MATDESADASLPPGAVHRWMGDGVPPELEGRALRTSTALYFRQDPPDAAGFGVVVTCGLALLVVLGSGLLFGLSVGGALGTMGGVLAVGGLVWRVRHPWVRVDRHGVSTGGFRIRRAARRVVVAGRTGHGMVLTVGGTVLLELDASMLASDPARANGRSDSRGWTVRSVTWVAEQIAAMGGLELVDKRELAGWHRWAVFPQVRAHIAWHREKASNRKDYPRLHAMVARPFAFEQEPQGFSVNVGRNWRVQIDDRALIVHPTDGTPKTIALDDVLDARVRFDEGTQPLVRAHLEVLVEGECVEVLWLRFRAEGRSPRGCGLHWLVEEILSRLDFADPETLDTGRGETVGDHVPSMPAH